MNREQIYRELIGYYLSGSDEIIVKAEKITYEQRAAVRELTYRLIGYECMENIGNQMLLKNSLNHNHSNIPEFTHRMMSNTISMFADTARYLEEGDRLLARDVIERDVEVDRLAMAIMRATNIRMYEIDIEGTVQFSISDAVYYKSLAVRLERMADYVVRIADYFLMMTGKVPELGGMEKATLKKTLEHLNLCQEIILSPDKRKSHQFLDIFLEFNVRKIHKKDPSRSLMDIVVSESISRVNSLIANVAEETINYINIKSTVES
jgi:phosphate uptake regulator